MHVLEVFDKQATKWSAVRWLARERGIDPSRVAAIGDELNDVDIIRTRRPGHRDGQRGPRGRGEAACRAVRCNDEDGVAYAIGKLLSGEW